MASVSGYNTSSSGTSGLSNRSRSKSESYAESAPIERSLSSDDTTSGDEKDSPAFRLRPRRSTPKPSSNTGRKRRYPYFSPKSPQVFSKLKYKSTSPVKRKLFKFENQEGDDRVFPPPSPSRSMLEDVHVGVFVEKIAPGVLEAPKEYPANYVCLKIVYVFDASEDQSEDVLKLLAQEADENEDLVNHSKPLVFVYLFGTYAKCTSISIGKIIEVVKFKTTQVSEGTFSINDCDIYTLPYHLIVRSQKDPLWVPVLSVKTKYELPENPTVLTPPPEKANPFSTIHNISSQNIYPTDPSANENIEAKIDSENHQPISSEPKKAVNHSEKIKPKKKHEQTQSHKSQKSVEDSPRKKLKNQH